MEAKLWVVLALLASSLGLSACGPALVGAGGAVVADEVVEEDGGNLF